MRINGVYHTFTLFRSYNLSVLFARISPISLPAGGFKLLAMKLDRHMRFANVYTSIQRFSADSTAKSSANKAE